MNRFRSVVAVALIAIAACGGGGGEGQEAGGSGDVVRMTDFAFEPAEVAMAAGEERTLRLENAGSTIHDWIVLQEGVTVVSEDEIPDDPRADAGFAFFGEELAAGTAMTVRFVAPTTPGTYQIICAVPGHFSAGMAGELVVAG